MRAAAAERRADQLEKQLARKDDEERASHPIVAVPEKFVVTRTAEKLTVTWRWFGWYHLLLALFAIVWDAGIVVWYSNAGEGGIMFLVAPILHVVGGIYITYTAAANLLNSTTVTAQNGELHIKHAPLPWPGNRTLRGSELEQLYVRETERRNRDSGTSRYIYELCSLLPSGKELRLLKELTEASQARYLEHIFEQHLGIPDRPVLGELSEK